MVLDTKRIKELADELYMLKTTQLQEVCDGCGEWKLVLNRTFRSNGPSGNEMTSLRAKANAAIQQVYATRIADIETKLREALNA